MNACIYFIQDYHTKESRCATQFILSNLYLVFVATYACSYIFVESTVAILLTLCVPACHTRRCNWISSVL